MPSTDTNAQQRAPLSVSEAVALAKGALESVTVTLIGEVSEVSNKRGYKAVYFTIKDEDASMPCMMWVNRFESCGVEIQVGSLVQLTGRFSLYAKKGRMNFDVFTLSLAGEGDLRARVANLAKRLQSEGLMDAQRKRPLPTYPETIGLVTSPRGAAVHDVLRTLRRRYPLARILLAGVPVEGANAPKQIVDGMAKVVFAGADVVLLVRGGGSFEDLMPFNDELLARTISRCPVPVVTGIGHEPDTSIADMVADVRASTPTAAAETVAPDKSELADALSMNGKRMGGAVSHLLVRYGSAYNQKADRPLFKDPTVLYAERALALDYAADRLHRAIPYGLKRDEDSLKARQASLKRLLPHALETQQAKLDATQDRIMRTSQAATSHFEANISLAASRLHDLSPLAVLGRGYALAKDAAGSVVSSVEDTGRGKSIDVLVKDGTINCTVDDIKRQQIAPVTGEEE